jgi:hypothetical protein
MTAFVSVVGSVESYRMLCCGLYIPVCDVARMIQCSVWGVPSWTESMWRFGYYLHNKRSNGSRCPARRSKLFAGSRRWGRGKLCINLTGPLSRCLRTPALAGLI